MTNKIYRIDMKNGFTYIGFLPKGPGKSDIALEKFTTVKTSYLSPEPYPEGTIGAQEGSWYLPRLSAYALAKDANRYKSRDSKRKITLERANVSAIEEIALEDE